jgi:hypothetical protein
VSWSIEHDDKPTIMRTLDQYWAREIACTDRSLRRLALQGRETASAYQNAIKLSVEAATHDASQNCAPGQTRHGCSPYQVPTSNSGLQVLNAVCEPLFCVACGQLVHVQLRGKLRPTCAQCCWQTGKHWSSDERTAPPFTKKLTWMVGSSWGNWVHHGQPLSAGSGRENTCVCWANQTVLFQ